MESKINLAQVAPVNYKVTAALVNQFIVSTTQFLNRFATRCDRKLQQVTANMHRIEVSCHHYCTVPRCACRIAVKCTCVLTGLRRKPDNSHYSRGQASKHW